MIHYFTIFDHFFLFLILIVNNFGFVIDYQTPPNDFCKWMRTEENFKNVKMWCAGIFFENSTVIAILTTKR